MPWAPDTSPRTSPPRASTVAGADRPLLPRVDSASTRRLGLRSPSPRPLGRATGARGSERSAPWCGAQSVGFVLNNVRRHAAQRRKVLERDWTDPCSSAVYFDGWKRPLRPPVGRDPPTEAPRSWLLGVGWRRHGLIAFDEVPGGATAAARVGRRGSGQASGFQRGPSKR
jgi:hypothetical protein